MQPEGPLAQRRDPWCSRGPPGAVEPLDTMNGAGQCSVSYGAFLLFPAALADVSEVVDQLQGSVIKMENFQKLLELRKDLIGADNLVAPGRVS